MAESWQLKTKKPRPEGEAMWRDFGPRGESSYFASSGSTMTNLPIEPLSTNLMRPVILANKVSSLPRPTLRPGLTRVPRCRTMIVPPGTTCPPKALKPSRCALESRPFRELPKPFLCAIDFHFPVSGFKFWCYFFFFGAAFLGAGFFAADFLAE